MAQADQWLLALGRHFQTGILVHIYLEERWDCTAKGGMSRPGGSASFGPKLAKREFGKREKLYQAPTL